MAEAPAARVIGECTDAQLNHTWACIFDAISILVDLAQTINNINRDETRFRIAYRA